MKETKYSITRTEKGPLKRSEVNRFIDLAIEFFLDSGYPLPEYATWSPADWKRKGSDYDEIRDLGLGWDITDFGSGDFLNAGRIIFTLRNGSTKDKRYSKPYAQKVMLLLEGQKSPIHYHRTKMEDIINHRGGNLLISLWSNGVDNSLSEEALEVSISGLRTKISAGDQICLKPGDSVTITPFTYHQFWAEEGKGPVLSMEVSTICDDYTDNFFLNPQGLQRFPQILEDELPRYVICNEFRLLDKI